MKYLAALTLFLFACRKNGQPGLPMGDYVICAINGNWDTFPNPYGLKTYDPLSPGGTTATIGVVGNDPQTGVSLNVGVENFPSHDSITTGIYWDSSAHFLTSGEYFIATGNYYDAGTSFYYQSQTSGIPMKHHLVMTITHLDSASISGTFSGDYYYADNYATGARATITGGIFSVHFHP